MYQRYYKQKRFGRIFSFFLVVGSGLSYYIKNGYRVLKETISLDNVVRYSDYFPQNLKFMVDSLKNNTNANRKDFFDSVANYTSNDVDFKKNYWIYENNIKRLCGKENKNDFVRINIINNYEDVNNKETYILYKKFKDKLI
jgi:hypothetical protein